MPTKIQWIPISKEAYFCLFFSLEKLLHAYSTYTNPAGDDGLSSTPQSLTEWGIDGASEPILKYYKYKSNINDRDWISEYYIAKYICGEDDK